VFVGPSDAHLNLKAGVCWLGALVLSQ